MKTNLKILLGGLASLLFGLGGQANANITTVSPGSITNGSGTVIFSDYGGAFSATAVNHSFGSLTPVTLSLGWVGGETDFAGGLRLVLTEVNSSGTPWAGFDFAIPTGPVVFYSGDTFTPGVGAVVTPGPTFGTFATDRYQSGANPNITVGSNNIHFEFSSQVANGSSFSTYLPFLFSGTPGSSGTISLTASPIAAIPEPEIYAMLAAGLGLMGFVARRRKQQLAAG
jgi:hypothetical protein